VLASISTNFLSPLPSIFATHKEFPEIKAIVFAFTTLAVGYRVEFGGVRGNGVGVGTVGNRGNGVKVCVGVSVGGCVTVGVRITEVGVPLPQAKRSKVRMIRMASFGFIDILLFERDKSLPQFVEVLRTGAKRLHGMSKGFIPNDCHTVVSGDEDAFGHCFVSKSVG
jgi:hypothetical protein